MSYRKWVLVTGAASGIGRAIAPYLSREGFGVYTSDREKGLDPAEVAKAVHEALVAERQKPRYLVDANQDMINAARGLPDEQLDEILAVEMAKWGK